MVKTTYNLEGDGPLALSCYEAMSTVLASIQAGRYPNVQAVSKRLSNGDAQLYQKWYRYAVDCVEPGLEYFADAVGGTLGNSMAVFKAARLFSPQKAAELQPDAMPFLDAATLQDLKRKLPVYLAKVADISPDYDPLQWWRMNSTSLPCLLGQLPFVRCWSFNHRQQELRDFFLC